MANTIRNGVIVMTALPPTTGHLSLIEFASHFLRTINDSRAKCGHLTVIVNTRSFEPPIGPSRSFLIQQEVRRLHLDYNVTVVEDGCDDAPQNPTDDPNFWNWWDERIRSSVRRYSQFDLASGDYLFASEMYGVELAAHMNLSFVPFDVDRMITPARGTSVRQDWVDNWDYIIPSAQPYFRKRITIFGAESCGKTTMCRRLAQDWVGSRGQQLVTSIPEWARLFLEARGPVVDGAVMDTIMRGQHAVQSVFANNMDTPILVQDTDLLSTIGYYEIMQCEFNPDIMPLFEEYNRSHLYIVMNSNIPFEADPLRYGITKRESSDQFWIDLLEQHQRDYYVVKATDPDLQFSEVKQVISKMCSDSTAALTAFVRT